MPLLRPRHSYWLLKSLSYLSQNPVSGWLHG